MHESLMEKYMEYGLSAPIFHAHTLEKIDERIQLIKSMRVNPGNSIDKLLESKELRRQIDSHPEWSWNVISLVSDPMAHKISAFFQLPDEYIPDWQQKFRGGNLVLTDLQEMFYEKGGLNMRGLNNWFEEQVKPIWGIDVYGTPFSKERGYQIYKQNPGVNIMIIRMEDLNRAAKDAFLQFLGIEDFTVVKTNVGAEKPYSKLNNQFKALPMPADNLREVYDSRYARHFYNDQELEKFCSNWNQA